MGQRPGDQPALITHPGLAVDEAQLTPDGVAALLPQGRDLRRTGLGAWLGPAGCCCQRWMRRASSIIVRSHKGRWALLLFSQVFTVEATGA